MTTLASLDQQPEINLPGNEFPRLYDPAPIPDTLGAKAITQVIEANASWLQAEPRSSLGIILKLFPGMVRRMKDALEVIDWLGDYLWDAGYQPRWTNSNNPTWYWLEGGKLNP